MSKSLPELIDRSLVFSIALLVFLIPLFFLPITGEYYEFNKQALLVAVVSLGFGLLVIKNALAGELRWVKTKFDLPIFLLLAVFVASTVFSTSPATSFLGHYGRFHGGLLSLFLYIGLFYLVVNTVNSLKFALNSLIFAFLLSALVLSALSIFQYFEIYLFPWDFTHQRFWTPLGSPKATLFYLLINLGAIFLFWWGFRGFRRLLAAFTAVILIGAVFFISGWGGPVRNFLLPEKYRTLPTEITLDWSTSWRIATRTLADYPLLGSGPATFLSDFTRFKPPEFSLRDLWNLRFDKAGNEALEVLATLGLVGLVVVGWFFAQVGKLAAGEVRKNLTLRNWQLLALSAIVLSFILSLFFYYTTTSSSVLFWIVLALFVGQTGLTETLVFTGGFYGLRELTQVEKQPESESATYPFRSVSYPFVLVCLALILAFLYFYFGRYFLAEARYGAGVRAFRANLGTQAYQNMREAVRLNPYFDVYQTGFSAINLALANAISRQESPDAALIQQLVSQAITAGRRATQLNKLNVNNWENLVGIYRNLINYAQGADQWALASFNQAIALDPANPRLRENLGNFFLANNQPDQAIDVLTLAINLRPEFAQAHYDLAQAFKINKDYDQAKAALERVLEIVPDDSPARPQVESEFQEVEKLALGEALPEGVEEAPRPTFEAQEATPSAVTPPSRFAPSLEPLASPSGGLREISPESVEVEVPQPKEPGPTIQPSP